MQGGSVFLPHALHASPADLCGPQGRKAEECLRTIPPREHGGNMDIRHLGVEPCVVLGELAGRQSLRAANIVSLFERAGVGSKNPRDIWSALWEKFLFIASFGGVGAVTRAPAEVMRNMPETRRLLGSAMGEIHELAQAKGVSLRDDAVARSLAFLDGMPADATASMQRDIMEGRPSELESQNGAVVRLGEASGVPTPVHEFIYHALLPMETLARARAGAR